MDDLFVEAGGTNTPESSFTPHTLSLAAYAGQLTWLRFNFTFTGGSYYPQSDNYIGWNIENGVLTNVQQQLRTVVDTTNFTFTPTQAGTYNPPVIRTVPKPALGIGMALPISHKS